MIRYKPRGQYSGVMDEHKDGPFVLHTEAQTEIDALHAECDRLTSLLQYEEGRRTRIGTHGPGCWNWGPSHYECALREIEWLTGMLVEPQKVLEADDVTEPGFYWHRLSKGRRWSVRSVWASGNPQRPLFVDHPEIFGELEGQFVGPLKAPEGL